MQVTKKNLEKSQIELTVELTAEEFKPYIEKGVKKLSEEMKIEGFRPGKAPFEVLKQKIGEITILEESARIAINKTVETAIKENSDEQIVGQPQVDIIKLAPNNPLIYKITFSVLPEVTLGNYKDFKIKKEKTETTNEEVDKVIDNLRDSRAKEIIADREIKEGDKVIADIDVFLDNVPIEGGQGKGTAIIIGKDYLIPGFDKKIIGAKKEESREFSLPYPKDHYQTNLAGKMVLFRTKIKEIYERQLPEINDELAKNFGLKNIEEMKKNIKDSLEQEKDQKAEQEAEIKIFDKILEKTKFGDMPEVLVDHEVKTMMAELEQTITSRGGKFSDYLASIKKTSNELTLDLLPNAVKRVKTALIVRQISLEEKIKVDEKEIDEKIEELLKQYKGYAKVEERVKEPAYRGYLENSLTNKKVLEKLKEWNLEK
ncbi:MAG: trigger factor [Patescibacteria group bacterium]